MENEASHPVAIVTGGGQGIGKAVASALLQAAYQVFIWDNDQEAVDESMHEFTEMGEIHFSLCDISDEGQVKNALSMVTERAGRLDLLVNNAGIGITKSVEDLSLQEWNTVIGTNLTGAFLCSKHCAALLRRTRGSIINIASTRAHMSEPNTEAYSASKGGIIALTHALAISLGPSIRVNCISPGWIDVTLLKKKSKRIPDNHSEADHLQHPVGRIGIPADVVEMVLFLAGPKTGFITGQEFIIDGGITRKMIYV